MNDVIRPSNQNDVDAALTLDAALGKIDNSEGEAWVTLREVEAAALVTEIDRLNKLVPAHETLAVDHPGHATVAEVADCRICIPHRPTQKASERLPRCDCDPDLGCRKLDPAQFICCSEERERKPSLSEGEDRG
jgi:hypothetical protein